MYKSQKNENGIKAELFLLNILINKGYTLFKHRYRTIGNEQDVVVYKYVDKKDILLIRVVEVKFRNSYKVLYEDLGIDKKYYKFCKVKSRIVNDVLKVLNHSNTENISSKPVIKAFIEFDLAIISITNKNSYYLVNYIKNANLLC